MENLAKRLLALNDLGCYLIGRDGHIWIEEINNSLFSEMLKIAGVILNNKIYGGILEALDTIDEALKLAKYINLIEYYENNKDRIFLGNPGVDNSRINKTSPKMGGLF
jgi:hypothetical protein